MKAENMKPIFSLILLTTLIASAPMSSAEPLVVKPGDTLQKQIQAQTGKKITVRLQSGEELTGTVKLATNEILHLGELAGKEFFDAVIDPGKISAILIRTK
ncbi:hypothetical protein BH11PSE11_BH11PSE11_22980 [soil metagenome]